MEKLYIVQDNKAREDPYCPARVGYIYPTLEPRGILRHRGGRIIGAEINDQVDKTPIQKKKKKSARGKNEGERMNGHTNVQAGNETLPFSRGRLDLFERAGNKH